MLHYKPLNTQLERRIEFLLKVIKQLKNDKVTYYYKDDITIILMIVIMKLCKCVCAKGKCKCSNGK